MARLGVLRDPETVGRSRAWCHQRRPVFQRSHFSSGVRAMGRLLNGATGSGAMPPLAKQCDGVTAAVATPEGNAYEFQSSKVVDMLENPKILKPPRETSGSAAGIWMPGKGSGRLSATTFATASQTNSPASVGRRGVGQPLKSLPVQRRVCQG